MKCRSAAFLIVMIMALSGCGSKIRLGYSPIGTVVPIMKPGEKLEFNVPVEWDPPQQHPCDPRTVSETFCRISRNIAGDFYRYKCPKHYCDPEILIDVGGLRARNVPPVIPLAASVVQVVMACELGDGGKYYARKKQPEGDIVLPSGGVALFGLVGNFREWKLTFSAGMPQTNICVETATIESGKDNSGNYRNKCTAKASGVMPAEFRIEVTSPMGCNPSGPITIRQ